VALAIELLAFGLPAEQVAAALLCDLKCNAPITKLPNETQRRNAADRAIYTARTKIAAGQKQDTKPDDRGVDDNSEIPLYQIVAAAFFDDLEKQGHELRVVIDKDKCIVFWFHDGDVWSMIPDVAAWLNPKLQTATRGIKHAADSSIKLIAEARFAIMSEPAIIANKPVVFDDHGMVPIKGFLINPITRELIPMTKEHYCTWHLGDIYDKNAKCPHWEQMLHDSFANETDGERAKVIALQQEFLGAALIDRKPKALRRALVYQGPPDCGKTELIKTMSGLLTDSPIATPLADLNAGHGLQEFAKRVVWVLHEAFDQGVWHLSSRVKAILSGDPQSINPKHTKAVTMLMRVVAMWATNSPPKFKESTDAILIRLIIIRMKMKFIPGQLIGTALEAKNNGYAEPHEFVLATEKPGMLNWALDGLQRVLPRGKFSDTEDSKAAADEMRIDSNYMAGFIADCVTFSGTKMLAVPDLHLALGSWWKENRGDEKIPPGADAIGRQLAALHDQRIGQDNKKFRNREGVRFHPGLTLNTAGLDHFASEVLRQTTLNCLPRGVSITSDPAKTIPAEWESHPQIKAIKELAKAAEAAAALDPEAVKEAELAAERARKMETKF
jgi:hypothetical protein